MGEILNQIRWNRSRQCSSSGNARKKRKRRALLRFEVNRSPCHFGHDCHSIVAGAGHADAIIAQLRGYQAAGIDLVLTSHYAPEDQKDVQTKIDYLESLKRIAADCADAAGFKAAVQKRYPEYAGENYLDMTCGFFFGAE